jgi:hypothetical protein
VSSDIVGRDAAFGPWNPGIQSEVPHDIAHLATIFRPENVFGSRDDARELHDLSGLDLIDLVVFRPERLALHEILVRVTADLSVPDGNRIEDLGINFRAMTRVILGQYVEPAMAAVTAAYNDAKQQLAARVDAELSVLMRVPVDVAPVPRQRSLLKSLFRRRQPAGNIADSGSGWDERLVAQWTARAHADGDEVVRAASRALARVISALLHRHGGPWGTRELIGSLVTGVACNELAGDRIGAALDPILHEAARREGFALLRRQERPVVMNTKGASASGKSTLRPLQRNLAARIGVDWREFALISPDIWRKQLLDYESLGDNYKYAGAFTGDEIAIIDAKLDRYMARKASHGGVTHLLIDRFRFDSFAADSDEAGSNLLTRFGQIVYLFLMITPPVSLVERAWRRGLDVGRYKSVDDVLAHGVDAYSGMPGLFFTWANRADKEVHFEFLDNSVAQGERPRTVAFGWNDALNVLDIGCLLDIERYRRVDVNATGPESLCRDPALLAPERNTAFLVDCVRRFREVNFADQATGRVYARILSGALVWVDPQALAQAAIKSDTRAGLAVAAPGIFERSFPPREQPVFLQGHLGAKRIHTLGRWGSV